MYQSVYLVEGLSTVNLDTVPFLIRYSFREFLFACKSVTAIYYDEQYTIIYCNILIAMSTVVYYSILTLHMLTKDPYSTGIGPGLAVSWRHEG